MELIGERRQSRPASGARSRSRGRTPSEMLARRQQLLAGSGSGEPGQAPGEASLGRAKESNGSEQSTSAELKLESLSAQLREQQQLELEAGGGSPNGPKSIADVYILLAKKEKDLQLAAELGKVLLERNEQLSKANEQMAEEFSQKLELLEQDKHKLRRKLDQLDGEYENRLIELQSDCNILKNQLDQKQQAARQAEKEKSKLIDDLMQQNQRLTGELAEATKSEELLSQQLEQVQERLGNRLSHRQDHVAQVDALQQEVQILNQRKQDLERRLKLAQQDKSNLSHLLEESSDKLMLMESVLNEKDLKLGELVVEANELRDSSSWLSAKLETMVSLNERLAARAPGEPTADALGQLSERERSHLVEQLKELRLKCRTRVKTNQELLLLETAQHRRQLRGAEGKRMSWSQWRRLRRSSSGAGRQEANLSEELRNTTNSSGSSLGDELDDEADLSGHQHLSGARRRRREKTPDHLLAEISSLLRKFHSNLLHRKESIQLAGHSNAFQSDNQTSSGQQVAAADSGISTDEAVELQQVTEVDHWRKLLDSLAELIEELPCSSCHLLMAERADYEHLQRQEARLVDELRRKSDELLRANELTIEQAAQLAVLEEKCRLLADDLANLDKPQEEIVRLAFKARDEAVGRKNGAEIALAKTRIESMQIASQLMEVVQQKGELSQRLAQFEDDLHYITQHSVQAKFTWEERAEEMARRNKASRGRPGSSLATTGYQSISPLVQLLSFSSGSGSGSAGQPAAGAGSGGSATSQQVSPSSASGDGPKSQQQQVPAGSSSGNLFGARLNLRFWQRAEQ